MHITSIRCTIDNTCEMNKANTKQLYFATCSIINTWGRTWFRRGCVVFEKRVEGTCGPALKNYGNNLNAKSDLALVA